MLLPDYLLIVIDVNWSLSLLGNELLPHIPITQTRGDSGIVTDERLMRGISRAHSRAAGSTERLEAMQALSTQEDSNGISADKVVSAKQSAEKAQPCCTERTVPLSQATLEDDFQGNAGFTKHNVSALDTVKGHTRMLRTDNQLEGLPLGLVSKSAEKTLRLDELENGLLREVKCATSLRTHGTEMMKAALENQQSSMRWRRLWVRQLRKGCMWKRRKKFDTTNSLKPSTVQARSLRYPPADPWQTPPTNEQTRRRTGISKKMPPIVPPWNAMVHGRTSTQ